MNYFHNANATYYTLELLAFFANKFVDVNFFVAQSELLGDDIQIKLTGLDGRTLATDLNSVCCWYGHRLSSQSLDREFFN